MHRLLIAQCGRLKLPHRAKALDMYRGSLWQSVRIHAPGRARIAVLSAKYGLISAERQIDPYDLLLTPKLADEIADRPLPRELFENIQEVCIVGGHLYADLADLLLSQAVMEGVLPADIPVTVFCEGIGSMRSAMNRWLHQEARVDA
jgi:hypothetical protein